MLNKIQVGIVIFILLSFASAQHQTIEKKWLNDNQHTIAARFISGDGFYRKVYASNTFEFYLQNLKLKPNGSFVKYFDGKIKDKKNVYCAVVDMPISKKDLQQCADAVMRLRGEYLYAQKKYDEIGFRFLSDGKLHSYKDYVKGDYTYAKFLKYMDYVFTYANTASLKKQLKLKSIDSIDIGDVFIQSGNPYGHAVIVVDLCKNKDGQIKVMLAQSYMPAQETQVLINPKDNSCWYLFDSKETIIETPEWTFSKTDLRTW
ncbi:MAG: DUF4846 domain-containing protein [Bacteroidota bacterium]|nr:DUF4846 domain-containing protein [Bacteroidota bacterium]